MKKYVSPSLVEYGHAGELIQGCGGWGLEGFSLNDADAVYIWDWVNGKRVCVCRQWKGEMC